jgi:nitronate monooxygenase
MLKNVMTELLKIEYPMNSFGVNLFVPNEFNVTENEVRSAYQLLNPIRQQLNLPQQDNFEILNFHDSFEKFIEQVKVVMEEKVSICSFTFSIPPKN